MLKVTDTISNWYHRTSMFHFSTCKICKRSVRAFRKCSPPLLSKSLMNSITNYLSTNDCLLPTSVPQNQFWAHVLPPYQSSSINFNYAAIGVKIRSKRRSYNFTKYVIANRDHLPCTLIYDTAPPIFFRGEQSINFIPVDVSIGFVSAQTITSSVTHLGTNCGINCWDFTFFFQFQHLLKGGIGTGFLSCRDGILVPYMGL